MVTQVMLLCSAESSSLPVFVLEQSTIYVLLGLENHLNLNDVRVTTRATRTEHKRGHFYKNSLHWNRSEQKEKQNKISNLLGSLMQGICHDSIRGLKVICVWKVLQGCMQKTSIKTLKHFVDLYFELLHNTAMCKGQPETATMDHQLHELYSPRAMLEPSGIKCIIYSFLRFGARCIQDE